MDKPKKPFKQFIGKGKTGSTIYTKNSEFSDYDKLHKGKKGSTDVTIGGLQTIHKGKKGFTQKSEFSKLYGDNNYLIHKNKKGTTAIKENANTGEKEVRYTSNKTGKNFMKKFKSAVNAMKIKANARKTKYNF
jgi:hypothetical protein